MALGFMPVVDVSPTRVAGPYPSGLLVALGGVAGYVIAGSTKSLMFGRDVQPALIGLVEKG